MSRFPAYASKFEFWPKEGEAHDLIAPLFDGLERVDFDFEVLDPRVNQGQFTGHFDRELRNALHDAGAKEFHLKLLQGIPQQYDFAFSYRDKKIVVEIEKANQEKILRDLLKSHMYLRSGADFALVVLPRNYAHSKGMWDLFRFGVERYNECLKYGFGTPEGLGKVLLVGYTQFDGESGGKMNVAIRQRMRSIASRARMSE